MLVTITLTMFGVPSVSFAVNVTTGAPGNDSLNVYVTEVAAVTVMSAISMIAPGVDTYSVFRGVRLINGYTFRNLFRSRFVNVALGIV